MMNRVLDSRNSISFSSCPTCISRGRREGERRRWVDTTVETNFLNPPTHCRQVSLAPNYCRFYGCEQHFGENCKIASVLCFQPDDRPCEISSYLTSILLSSSRPHTGDITAKTAPSITRNRLA